MKGLASSEKGKSTGTAFVLVWGLTIALAGGVFYPLFITYTLNYLGQSPGLGGIRIAYEIKDEIARSLGHEPVLYVLGGSSAYLGINAQLMEKRLNHRVVNYGMHGGLGLEYQIRKLMDVLKTGDAVLLAFERNLYAEWEGWFSDLLHHYVFTYDPGYLWRIGPIRAYKRVYGVPFRDLQVSLDNWWKIAKGDLRFTPERQLTHLEVSSRGDVSTPKPRIRPLRKIRPHRLNPYAKRVIRMFCNQAGKMNVKVYFTWPTNFKHEGLMGEEAALERISFLEFFDETGVTVLGKYSDQLYPLSFFSDTSFHLTPAGNRIRTEKLIRALKPYLDPENLAETDGDIFLLDENVHQIRDFPLLHDLTLDYRVYVKGPEGPDTLNDRGFREAIKRGKQIYFSDVTLAAVAFLNNYTCERVLCNRRMLSQDIKRFENHIFFLAFNEIDRIDGVSQTDMASNFRKPLGGVGYRCLVLGTGKYKDVHKEIRHAKKVELSLQRGDTIGSFHLPFDLRMMSSPDYARIALNGGPLFRETPKPGLWMLVYDPELGIVVDEFIYEDMGCQMADCLYGVGPPLKNSDQVKKLETMDLSLTGANPPKLEEGEVIAVRYTGKNSFVGVKLTDKMKGKGSLVMEVLKNAGGVVRAGLQTNSPSKFSRLSPTYSLVDSEDWQRVIVPFEVFSHVGAAPGAWGYAGLWGNNDKTEIRIRNIKLVAFGDTLFD